MARNTLRQIPWRKLLIIPPVLAGGVALTIFIMLRDPPARRLVAEQSRTLRVIRLIPIDVIPRVVGHGTSKSARVARIVAEVSGRVVSVHRDLRAGAIIAKGSELLRIDPTEYELAIAQLEADIAQIDAQIAELDGKGENLQASLKIDVDSLTLVEADLARTREAFEQNAANQLEIDERERAMLAQRQIVQNLRNSINLLPAQRQAAEASRVVKQAQLDVAKLDLTKTVITAPFACRIGAVDIQLRQFLQTNETLFEAFGIDRTEIEAQMRLGAIQGLLRGVGRDQLSVGTLDLETMRRIFNVEVEVRVEIGAITGRWEATFDRVRENIDSKTRTVGVVVAVDRPYENVVPGERPPLIEGLYCEVELRGAVQSGRLVVPRSAVHGGAVYVVSADQRLERRPVTTGLIQYGIACIDSGLAAGELVIVSDPTPAIEGMLVDAVLDDEVQERLVAGAKGEEERE